jgi:hypothetical protein
MVVIMLPSFMKGTRSPSTGDGFLIDSLQRSPYGNSWPGAGAVHHIKSCREQMQQHECAKAAVIRLPRRRARAQSPARRGRGIWQS